jgi:hypothetical protein
LSKRKLAILILAIRNLNLLPLDKLIPYTLQKWTLIITACMFGFILTFFKVKGWMLIISLLKCPSQRLRMQPQGF